MIKTVFRIRIRIIGGLLDPDPHGRRRIRIQEVTNSEIKLKIAITYKSEKKGNLKIKNAVILLK